MECINCSNKEVTPFFNEQVDCFHCNESNNIVYYVCRDCGMIFRIINETINEVVAQANPEQLGAFYGGTLEQNNYHCCNSMQQMVHHCLKCNAFAYEVSPGLYECSKCSFSWEKI